MMIINDEKERRMSDNMDFDWGRALLGELLARWPKDENGEPERPAFLCNCDNIDMSDVLRVNMLEAYSIPCLRVYPGDGSFGRVVLGMSGQGTDIYVPESLLEDATELCKEENNEEL